MVNLALSKVRFYHNAAFDLQNCLDLAIKKNNSNNFVFAILSERLPVNWFKTFFLYFFLLRHSNIWNMLVFITEVTIIDK